MIIKTYSTTKDMGLIHEKILNDYPYLKGDLITTPELGEHYINPKTIVEGNGTLIKITIFDDKFSIRKIDDIIQNYNPQPRTRKKLTDDEILTKMAERLGVDRV